MPSFDNSQISQLNGEQKKLVIIFDEMSGINSLESSGSGGKEFVEQAIIFLKEVVSKLEWVGLFFIIMGISFITLGDKNA